MLTHTHVHACSHTHTHTYALAHTHTRAHTHTNTRTRLLTHQHTYALAYTQTHVCAHTNRHARTNSVISQLYRYRHSMTQHGMVCDDSIDFLRILSHARRPVHARTGGAVTVCPTLRKSPPAQPCAQATRYPHKATRVELLARSCWAQAKKA